MTYTTAEWFRDEALRASWVREKTRADPTVLDYLQGTLLQTLNQEEAHEWQAARAEADALGTFFMAWSHHGAVGRTKTWVDRDRFGSKTAGVGGSSSALAR